MKKDPPLLLLQNPHRFKQLPREDAFSKWLQAVFNTEQTSGQICVRFEDSVTMQRFNQQYRQKDYPTNVLSFSVSQDFDFLMLSPTPYLGDILMCPTVIQQESPTNDVCHWAHLFIHSVLHLLGYTHEHQSERTIMESKESQVLLALGFNDPYQGVSSYEC